ncbi:Small auxin-up RNA [Sesbania bispinosa]|nr:Small auxin-up RNA [Sesbania bispinosa]
MSKGGKLTKLKSVLKKWNSFSNSNSKHSRATISAVANDGDSPSGSELCPVFVGKKRRRYLVSSVVVGHPLFRELVDRSREPSDENDDDDTINVACEVVLFEHLLWMLENADPQPESLDELVEFYAC